MVRHLISILDIQNDLNGILNLASELKMKQKNGVKHELLKGKSLGMVFEKPSLRTRVSFEVGMAQLGGNALYISPSEIQIGKRESVHDVAKVLSRFVDGIMYRAFDNNVMRELARHADVPVINGLDNKEHPCQIVADLLTIKEHKGSLKGLKLCWVGDGNNVCNSLLLGTVISRMDMSVACPEDYEPDAGIYSKAKRLSKKNGTRILITREIKEAVKDADVVVTDTWVSMGDEVEKAKRETAFKGYQVNSRLMKWAAGDAIVMHCLPAHRGQEITDEVMDSKRSVVFDEAENRLHAQKAIMVKLMR
ncbi:MAG: ornithine carbamoyltransferase [Thermoplasmata archaeon]